MEATGRLTGASTNFRGAVAHQASVQRAAFGDGTASSSMPGGLRDRGSNLIGAAPEHPLIGHALRLAVEVINRGDNDIFWLSIGPGLLTRAFTSLLADPGREPLAALDDTVVLEHGALQRTVAVHCLVGYKNTDRHWSRTPFGRRAAVSPSPRPPSPATSPEAARERQRVVSQAVV